MNKISKGFFIGFILVAASCEKKSSSNGNDTIIFGTVVDSKTNQPIQGASIVRLDHCSSTSPLTFTTFITQTDNGGKFELKQVMAYSEPDDRCSTIFAAQCKGYARGETNYKVGAITESNIKLVKNSFLKIHIKNETPCNPSGSHYSFSINGNDYGTLYPLNNPNNWTLYTTRTLDTTFIVDVIPNSTHAVNWYNGCNTLNSKNETIYFTSGDTVFRAFY